MKKMDREKGEEREGGWGARRGHRKEGKGEGGEGEEGKGRGGG